jgi:hypothetical protein
VTGRAHPSLDECVNGFRIDSALHRWGTCFDAIVAEDVGDGYVSHPLPCNAAYGFETVFVELTADAPDRPVTSLAYELAATIEPRDAFARLVVALGQPGEISREEVSEDGSASDSVTLYATWNRDTWSIGLSLYGAPRPSELGDGVGKLYLSWTDTEAAAAPFIAAWATANQALAEAAKDASPTFFAVQYPIFDPDQPAPSPSERALSNDAMLQTPADAAQRLGSGIFALWSDKAGAWYLSTGRDTIRLAASKTATLQWIEYAPARGGGSSTLQVGGWSVRDAYRSPAIAEAVKALEKIPGLTIERHTGHDV